MHGRKHEQPKLMNVLEMLLMWDTFWFNSADLYTSKTPTYHAQFTINSHFCKPYFNAPPNVPPYSETIETPL